MDVCTRLAINVRYVYKSYFSLNSRCTLFCMNAGDKNLSIHFEKKTQYIVNSMGEGEWFFMVEVIYWRTSKFPVQFLCGGGVRIKVHSTSIRFNYPRPPYQTKKAKY